MSIPLDRLYHYIESIAEEICDSHVVIYRFYPHGSKKSEDLTQLRTYPWITEVIAPQIYCNDQEPLNYDLYEGTDVGSLQHEINKLQKENNITVSKNNFRGDFKNIFDKALLLHSEQRSYNVKKYQENLFIPVYYWSHAIIAQDWFRFAEYVVQKKNIKKRFLIYNRAWSGTREYRLWFADCLIREKLDKNCIMRISPVDSIIGKHYDLHHFENLSYRPLNVIEDYFPLCKADSSYSADFDISDYEVTDIEVVLETLFDDLRLHLTEKTLRPIALGQPFILVGTYGSLKYLREYGFKTFSDCWDESYDLMTNSTERMNKIIEIMKQITGWKSDKRQEIMSKAQEIADFNRQHFFSKKFQNQIINELQNNLMTALTEVEVTNTSKRFLDWRKIQAKNLDLRNIMKTSNTDRTRQDLANIIKAARQYYLRSLKHNS